MAPQLGWIGLGNMGKGMAKNLVEKGNLDKPLILFNRTKQRADDFSAQLPAGKSKVAASLDELVAASDIIWTSLSDDASIKDCIEAILKNDVKGKVIVETTTIHPDTTSVLNNSVTAQGAHFVACPVFGAPAMANSGQLVCCIAGKQADIDKIAPYTKGVIARENILFANEEPSKALTMKIIGNSMVLHMVESLSEAHTVAEKSGLGTQRVHDFVSAMMPGPYVAYSNRMITGDHVRESPLFHVDLALKDARHALDIAKKCGSSMPGLEAARKHLEDVKKLAGDKGDIAGIYGAVRTESGLPYGTK